MVLLTEKEKLGVWIEGRREGEIECSLLPSFKDWVSGQELGLDLYMQGP